MFEYRAHVLRVVDGDTVDVRIDLGFHVDKRERVRVAGIDAPELRSTDDDERAAAVRARAWLVDAIGGEAVVLRSRRLEGGDKYGRYLAEIVTASGVDVGPAMVELGLARRYDGGKRGV